MLGRKIGSAKLSRYKLRDGTPVARTSEILDLIPSPYLTPWACGVALDKAYDHSVRRGRKFRRADVKEFKKEYENVSGRACDIGTLAHAYIESFISKRIRRPDFSDWEKVERDVLMDHGVDAVQTAKGCFGSFLMFDKNVSPNYIASEVMAVSEEYLYGGTVDCLAEVNGKLVMMDWKTSSRIYDKYDLQAAAYANLGVSELKFDLDEFWILRFDKENHDFYEPKYILRRQLEKDFEIFKQMAQTHRMLKQRGFIHA